MVKRLGVIKKFTVEYSILGEAFISINQGFKVSSIITSKPYIS